MALESSSIISKTIDKRFVLTFDYKNMNKVMRIIKEKQITIIDQQMELECKLKIVVRKSNATAIYDLFNHFYGVTVKEL